MQKSQTPINWSAIIALPANNEIVTPNGNIRFVVECAHLAATRMRVEIVIAQAWGRYWRRIQAKPGVNKFQKTEEIDFQTYCDYKAGLLK